MFSRRSWSKAKDDLALLLDLESIGNTGTIKRGRVTRLDFTRVRLYGHTRFSEALE